MSTNALSQLDVDAKTAKRAQYEGFEFSIEGPGSVRITNGSYGEEANDHSYSVTVEDGVPVACECPADEYHDGACKHRVAVAIRGPIMDAADAETEAAVPVTDGGIVTETPTQDSDTEARITGPWTEPQEQGGATYYRCEDCGHESLRRSDLLGDAHTEDCR